ncbi:MAG: hypothetical protein IKI97_13010 [Clostridia bacterium]|nr:hypothetical protein [Clostridia bacterium]
MNKNDLAYRILLTITTPKLYDTAAKYFEKKKIPIHYKVNAVGTAPSNILDILGIGTSDKRIIICMLPKNIADIVIKDLYIDLMFAIPGNGIAFTMPLGASNNKLLKLMNAIPADNFISDGKEELIMSETKRVMIAAVVNPGFSEEVMNSAKSAGARGGTIIHGRGIAAPDAISLWGLGVQEEREIIIIVAESSNKLDIMNAISEKFGANTDANGYILSLPIDTIIGIGNSN